MKKITDQLNRNSWQIYLVKKLPGWPLPHCLGVNIHIADDQPNKQHGALYAYRHLPGSLMHHDQPEPKYLRYFFLLEFIKIQYIPKSS